MPSYLTPARYRQMALGIDVSSKTDAELAALIATASGAVNRYCAVPRAFDFRGGAVTDETHQWEPGNAMKQGSGKVWPLCKPVRTCTRLSIYVTKTQHIDFDASQVNVNPALGYLEPVAAPITTALFTSVPPWLLDPPLAYVDYTYGWSFTETERIYDPGIEAKIFRATNQFWTDDPTVEVNGSVVTTGFTVDRTEGTITFTNATTDPVDITYTYPMPPEIPLATGIVVTDLLGYANINASGLTGLSGIRVEEIEIRQSSRTGFANYDMHPAAAALLAGFVNVSWG